MPIVIHRRDGVQKLIGDAAKDRRFHYSDPVEQPLIRLLHLLPGADATSPLRGLIQTCNLDAVDIHEVEFEALSYTWDSQVMTEKLIVQEEAYIEIGHNLACFLHQRRDPKETVVLWIDAICINQEDIDERNLLVPVMRLSYVLSKKLTIWLGPESENSALAMSELTELGELHAFGSLPSAPLHIYQAIRDLLKRPWWTRVWIVQELCYGGRGAKIIDEEAVILRCGKMSIPWVTLVIACARLYIGKNMLPCSIPEIDRVLLLDSARCNLLRLLGMEEKKSAVDSTVLRLVTDHRQCNATDPRDKIYGLLGLAVRLSSFAKGETDYEVQYRDSVKTVYTRFALKMIAATLVFELLRECGGSAGFESAAGLPSWVPDWSLKRREVPLPNRSREKDQNVPWWAVPIVSDLTPGKIHARYTFVPEEARTEMLSVMDEAKVPSDFQNSLSQICQSSNGTYDNMKELMDGPGTLRKDYREEERATQRWFLRHWLDEKEERRARYTAGGEPQGLVRVDTAMEELKIEGVNWDSIAETAQHAFPEDLDSDWEASTYFMINVGLCKKLALQSARMSPYRTDVLRDFAFWHAITAGQDTGLFSPYHHFLPCIPKPWEKKEAPLTHCRPYYAECAEIRAFWGSEAKMPEQVRPDIKRFNDLVKAPLAGLSDGDAKLRKARWQDLADMSTEQPYDLYYRPFILPHMVPDPYWDSRVKMDDFARVTSNLSRQFRGILSPKSTKDSSAEPNDCKKKCFQDRLREHPSMLPPLPNEEKDFELEKYALGRRFFVTQRGYFGIGPAELQPGDRVVVFSGAQVPMILRRVRPSKYRIVGESYVSGIMKGEVMIKVSEGQCKVETITLV